MAQALCLLGSIQAMGREAPLSVSLTGSNRVANNNWVMLTVLSMCQDKPLFTQERPVLWVPDLALGLGG